MSTAAAPLRLTGPARLARRLAPALCLGLALCVLGAPTVQAEEPAKVYKYAQDDRVGMEPKLGGQIPLDLVFTNEAGAQVSLRSLFKRPTYVTLVYYGCPTICNKVLGELANTVDEIDEYVLGRDYDIITVSFDVREGVQDAQNAELKLQEATEKTFDTNGWHFLSGDEQSIMALADAIGFRFQQDEFHFKHAGSLVCTTASGKIISYLGGTKILPFDMKMGILDASKGTPRTIMQRFQQFCFAYDQDGRKYVLQINKIILFVSLFLVALIVTYLLIRRGRSDRGYGEAESGPGPVETPEERPV